MQRIDALIGRMTLAEKLGQLTMTAAEHAVTGPRIASGYVAAIRAGTLGNVLNLIGADHVRSLQRVAVEESRLAIPLLIGLDVTHGYRTLFPVSLAEASLFDSEAWTLSAREAAAEAASEGIAMTFAPMVDVARDPRWGRIVEGPGEDPWVGEVLSAAKVRGFQGADLAAGDSVAAVAKHFLGYGAVTAGREYASAEISERTLQEVHLPPFAAAVRAGVAAIMPAFHDIAGLPMTANGALLRTLLRERLRFDGVLVSDYNAIAELIQHGVASDLAEAATLALKAGVDIDMMAGAYERGLPVALARGQVSLEEIDAAVRRVLTLKTRLGLFDDPYRRGRTPESPATVARRRERAREIATRSIVLLTNRADTLPLPASLTRLGVVGPLADAPAEMRGVWWAAAGPGDSVSVLAGLRERLPGAEIHHAQGVSIDGADRGGIARAVELCERAQAIVLCLGEGATMSGEAASRAHLGLPGQQRALAEAVIERARSRGVPAVAVLFSGRPLIVPWLFETADAVLAAWFLGTQAGPALAAVLLGEVSPSGRTAITWPRSLGQVPLYYGQRPSGRPAAGATSRFTSSYLDEPNEPQFPFGHGLTYGRFRLSSLTVSPEQLGPADTLEARVTVENEGPRSACETVFLFTHDPQASVARPVLELRAVSHITLAPGERGTVALTVPARALTFLGPDLTPVFEPGELEILVGPCAERAALIRRTVRLLKA